jgi:hypothetical protein
MDDVELGPISYLVVEFPGARLTGQAMEELLRLTDQGLVRVLDLVFLMKTADGTVTVAEIADLDHDGTLDLAVFQGASSDLLGPEDIEEAAQAVEPDNAAAVLLFSNTWAIPFVRGLRSSGAQLVAAGYIPMDHVADALDLQETAG